MTETKKPGGLLDQWNLLAEIIADSRTRKPHIQIAQIVINRHDAKHGNGRASVRYLEKGTGLSKWRIGKATAELAEWGYFTRRPGIGTRPSEFTPSWPSVRVQRDTTPPLLVSESGGTGCPSPEGHYGPLVSESGGTNPAYVDGLQAGLREAESSDGAAMPPHAAGLWAAPGETPPGREGEPFTELWNAFNLKLTNTKPKAKAAYEKLSPDAGLHAVMVEAAARLHAHYEEHATERRYRIQCHNWINARGWEDDLPIVYADAKSAAISKTRGSAKPDAPTKAKASQGKHDFPAGETRLTITKACEEAGEKSKRLMLFLADANGKEFGHIIITEHYKPDMQQAGQDELESFVVGAGFYFAEPEAHELVGRHVVAIVDEDGLSWHAPREGQPKAEPHPEAARSTPTLEEINARAKADFDAWYEAEQDEAA